MCCGSNKPSARRRAGGDRAGFTFAEVLAAMVFLAVLVPVVIEGMTLANRAAVIAERKTVAAQLAAARLAELIVTRTWNSAQGGGNFGPDWPGYVWQVEVSSWQPDAMAEVMMVVAFDVQGREYFIELSTLVDPTLP